MSQFSEAIRSLGSFSCRSKPDHAHKPDEDWGRSASHWKVTLRNGKKSLTVGYHMGSAHRGEPVCTDVLHSVISDAQMFYQARGFEDFCGDLGYDPDSRKAEKFWKSIKATAPKVKRFVAPYSLDELSSLEH